jgi:hypothetical protein
MQRIRLPADAFQSKITPELEQLLKRIRVAEARKLLAKLESIPKLGQ